MTVTTAQARHQAGLYRVTGMPVAASIVVSLCDQLDALTLAFGTERDAANLYAKQVAHWIGKHDALLGQQPAAQAAQPAQPRLKVRLTAFPESNGKRNWTALLVREEKWDGLVGNCGGVSLARGELWNRVAWEAECARYLIGERDTEPFILDYGDDIETPDQWPGETHDRHRSRQGA